MLENEWVRPARRDDAKAVQELLGSEQLESDFVPSQFAVCEVSGRIVGCARAKPLPEGGTELASVAVAKDYRGRGLARSLVMMVLLDARHPVYALTLVPDIAAHGGFEPIPVAELPPSLRSKSQVCTTQGRPWSAMRLQRRNPNQPDSGPGSNSPPRGS